MYYNYLPNYSHFFNIISLTYIKSEKLIFSFPNLTGLFTYERHAIFICFNIYGANPEQDAQFLSINRVLYYLS